MCRVVQLAVMRLLATRTVMGKDAMSGTQAWQLIAAVLEDERVEFVPEPKDLDAVFSGLFRYREPTPNLINDAYLAAFAIASRRRLVTLDRGFEHFPGLDLEILA